MYDKVFIRCCSDIHFSPCDDWFRQVLTRDLIAYSQYSVRALSLHPNEFGNVPLLSNRIFLQRHTLYMQLEECRGLEDRLYQDGLSN